MHAEAAAIERLIAAGRYERALSTIHDTVEAIITEPLCTSQVYASARLDALAQQVGMRLLMEHPLEAFPPAHDLPTYVYLATKLQRSGGHTRLLRDFIFARPTARHIILLTGLAGKSATDWLTETFAGIENYACLPAPRGGYAATVRWLQAQLRQIAPTHAYLFNHHEDVTIVAAMVPGLQLPASFCHHGDHHLSLGMHLPHVTHLDFHPTQFHRCREELGIANRYIPFTVAGEPTRGDAPFMPTGTLTTATAGGSNKLETPYPLRYIDLIPQLLTATGGTHIHMGGLSRRGLAAIAQGMKTRGIPAARFVYLPWVPSIRAVLLERQVDLYLSSFPLGGGLTAVEVMSAGIPLVVHQHMLTRELGGMDLVHAEAFRWRTVGELLDYLKRVDATELRHQSIAARAHYLAEYARPLRDMLEHPASHAPALTAAFQPQQDEWALWAAQQIRLAHVLRRFAYRRYRQWRRRVTRWGI